MNKRPMENLESVGKCTDGTTVYRFNYRGDPVTRMGMLPEDAARFGVGELPEVERPKSFASAFEAAFFNTHGRLPPRAADLISRH